MDEQASAAGDPRQWRAPIVSTAMVSALVVVSFLIWSIVGLETGLTGLVERTWSPAVFALIAVLLLTADVALPVPAALVMLGSGLALGPVAGSLVNIVGLVAAAALGYAVGRAAACVERSRRMLRFRTATDLVVDREGAWWVAITRGLPVLGEAVAITAGGFAMPRRSYLLGAVGGAVPIGVIYAVAGDRLHAGALIGVLVATGILALHGLVLVVRWRRPSTSRSTPAPATAAGATERRVV